MPAPASVKPQVCSNFKLRQLTRRVSQHYDAELGKSGLKTTQYSLLSHVTRLGPVRAGELARAMTMDASTLTRNLKPLVVAGWVTISAGSDARSHSIAISELGREKRQEAQRHWKAAQDGLNDLLGIDRVRALHALIDSSLALLSTGGTAVQHA
jgi:DNA-binding MarR family transcriptional regulator